MNVNNLSGPRMPTTTTVGASSSPVRTSFGTLVSGSAGMPVAARSGAPTGSSIVSKAISSQSQGVPGSGFGAPYMQAMNAGVPGTGTLPAGPRAGATPVHDKAPTAPGTPTAGSEFNGELKEMYEAQKAKQEEAEKALRDLMMFSMMSFMGASFSMGMNRPKMEFATAEE